MSLGEDRVRLGFNPSADNVVDQFKRMTADLIDACNENNSIGKSSEEGRLWALAMTYYEIAAMFAVKAATASQKPSIDPAVKEYPADHPASGDLGSVPL
jgi:hypothetical protein